MQEPFLRLMAQRFHLRWYVWSLCAVSLAYIFLGRWDDAVAEVQNALRVAEEFADSSNGSIAAWLISWAYTAKRDLGQAVEYGELAVQKAPTPADKMWAQAGLAWTWCRRGEPRRGLEIQAQVVSMHRAVSCIWAELFTPFLGEGYYLAGEITKQSKPSKNFWKSPSAGG